MKPRLIAFAGYARSGKDEAAKALVEMGYTRYNFGDIIKSQIDHLVLTHLGFSSFTEDDVQKKQIRGLLEQWGEANYDNILTKYMDHVDKYKDVRFVNTRIVRVREAKEWKSRGGVILCIERTNVDAATEWERDRLLELIDSRMIDLTIKNCGSPGELHDLVKFYATKGW